MSKKILSVILATIAVFTLTFSFAGCNKNTVDEPDISVSDNTSADSSEQSTDKNGKPVEDENTTASKKDKDKTTNKADKNKTTSAKAADKTTEKKTTEKQTTKITTTKAPEKREVSVTVKLPNYYNEEHEMILKYRVKDGKKWGKWKELDAQKVIFDGEEVKVKIGKLKGDVAVIVKFADTQTNNKLQDGCNKATIMSNEKSCYLELVTGIEGFDDMD